MRIDTKEQLPYYIDTEDLDDDYWGKTLKGPNGMEFCLGEPEDCNWIRDGRPIMEKLNWYEEQLSKHTPFKDRAEVETYLKGKGWIQNDPDEFQIPEESEDVEPVMISFIGNDVVAFDSGACNTKNFTLHLSLLTPALLDAILEEMNIKKRVWLFAFAMPICMLLGFAMMCCAFFDDETMHIAHRVAKTIWTRACESSVKEVVK